MRRGTYIWLAAAIVVLLVLGIAGNVDRGRKTEAGPAPTLDSVRQPPAAGASVAEIMDWAETARARWTSIRVEGTSGINGELSPFLIEVGLDGYICEDGSTTLRGDRSTGSAATVDSSEVAGSSERQPGAQAQAAVVASAAGGSGADPAELRPGEEPVFPSSLSDVVQPAYWVRKELGAEAKQVDYLGLEAVAGRSAFHLRAVFPPATAKEESWDVYIDRTTGIISKLVINPLPGGDRYEQTVTAVAVGVVFEPGHFEYDPSAGSTSTSLLEPTTIASTASGAAATSTSTGQPTPYLDESAIRSAQDVVNRYLAAVRADNLAGFSTLIDPASRADPGALLQEEHAHLQTTGQESFLLSSMKSLIWAGNGYLVKPKTEMPSEIDTWIREDPHNRAAMEAIMRDGSVRFFRVVGHADSGEWYVVPEESSSGL